MTPVAAAKPRVRLGTALGLARSIAVYYGQVWKPPRLRRFYARFVAPGDRVFDIGAHVGNRSRALAKLGARVVAVEPQALFHAWLARTLPAERATPIRAAVAARPGTLELYVARLHPTVSTADARWRARVAETPGFRRVRWHRAEQVPATTLDQLIATHGEPAFCKIDVEGMEPAALQGLSRPLPRLSLEVLPQAPEAAAACLDRLAELGTYRFNLVEGEGGRLAWPAWYDRGRALERLQNLRRSADLLAVRADLVPGG